MEPLSNLAGAAVLGLTLLHFLLRYVRWQAYLKRLGHHIPWRFNCASYMAGFALTATPGKVGETIRSVYLKPFGVDYSNSLAAFFAERYTDLLAVASLSMLAMAHFHGHLWPVIVAGLAILLALLIVRMPQLPHYIEQLQSRVRRANLKSGLGHLAAGLRASSSLLSSGPLLSGYILALLARSVQAYILYVILVSLGVSIVDYIAVASLQQACLREHCLLFPVVWEVQKPLSSCCWFATVYRPRTPLQQPYCAE